jgi:hypothetical protein
MAGPLDYANMVSQLNSGLLANVGDVVDFESMRGRGTRKAGGFSEGGGGGAGVLKFPEVTKAYHGTKGDWRSFDPNKGVREAYGSGLHAAPNPKLANQFAGQFKEGGSVMPLNLRLRKTASQDVYKTYAEKHNYDPKATTRALIKDGYDSVKYNHGQFYQLEKGKLAPSAPGEDAAISVLKPGRVWSSITGEKLW